MASVAAPMSADTGASSSGGDAFNSVMSEMSGLMDGGQETPGGESTEVPQPQEVPAETPGGEAPTSEAQPAQTGDDPFPLSEDGQNYIVPKAEIATYNGMKQYVDAVQGRFPTAQDAEISYLQSSDFRAAQADFTSGVPQNIDAFLNHWAGNDFTDSSARAQYQQSFSLMAERLPTILQQVNPQAYEQFAVKSVSPLIESLYMRAAQEQNPESQKALMTQAQYLEWGATGKYRTELPKYDPQAEAQKAEQARMSSVEQRENQLLNRDWQSFNTQSFEGARGQMIDAELDKVLGPAKGKFTPEVFRGIRESAKRDAITAVEKDGEFVRNHLNERAAITREYQWLWKAQQPASALKPRIDAYINDFAVRYRRALQSAAAPIIKGATAKAVTPTQQQSRTQARPQSQPSPPPPTQRKGPYSLEDDPEWKKAWATPVR